MDNVGIVGYAVYRDGVQVSGDDVDGLYGQGAFGRNDLQVHGKSIR